MLRLQSAASQRSSGNDNNNNEDDNGRPRMGVWLSYVPRKLYKCPLCHLSFHSLNALGGHQNAHRHQRNQMNRHPQSQSQAQAPPPPPPPVEPTQEGGLGLSLQCGGPDPRPRPFYEFLPLKEGYSGIYGYGYTPAYDIDPYERADYDQSFFPGDQPMQVMMADDGPYGRGSGSGGSGGGDFLGVAGSASSSGAGPAMFYEGMGDSEGAVMTEPDFTLKL